jgi:hypothetical protein
MEAVVRDAARSDLRRYGKALPDGRCSTPGQSTGQASSTSCARETRGLGHGFGPLEVAPALHNANYLLVARRYRIELEIHFN